MPDRIIRPAEPDDAPVVLDLLQALAERLGDGPAFRSTAALIRRHGFGPDRLFHSLLGFAGGVPLGLALYFPTFSTLRGAPGLYVQDLYVAPQARGTGLGRQLLKAASRAAGEAWGATHMTLTVHADNGEARGFYQRLGFVLRDGELPASLDERAMADLLAGP